MAAWLDCSSDPCCATSPRPRRPSGSRPATPARSRSSAIASPPSASTATTTRWSASTGWSRPPATSTRCGSTARCTGPSPTPSCRRARSARSTPTTRSTSASAPAGSRSPTTPPSPSPKTRPRSVTRSTPSGCWRSRWRGGEREEWPDQLFLLGDQVYVDEGSPQTRKRIRERRGTDTPPHDEVTDFEEYTWLYRESWEQPLIRWLFSTVSVSMLWDDHDMSDDWNISRGWLTEMRQRSWWNRRVIGCFASYWIYQHIGNLSPRELGDNEIYQQVRGQPGRRGGDLPLGAPDRLERRRHPLELLPRLRPHPGDLHRRPRGAGAGGGRRAIVDDEEWDWIVEHTEGDFDHLLDLHHHPLVALPRLRPPRGLERGSWSRGRLGQADGLGQREAAARSSTSTTGPRSASHSRSCATSCTRSPAARRARRRPRSSSSPATSTTPTSPRSPTRALPTAPRSTRRSARPTATRWTKKSGGSCARDSAVPLTAFAAPAGQGGRRPRPGDPLAHHRGPLLRQPGRDPEDRPPRRRRCASTRPSRRRRQRGARRDLHPPPRLNNCVQGYLVACSTT